MQNDIRSMDTWQLENKLRTLQQETAGGNFDQNTIFAQIVLMDEINRRQGEHLAELIKASKQKQERGSYFATMAEAIDTAVKDAEGRGYSVINNGFVFHPISYGHTERFTLELMKNDKLQKSALIIVLYRMETGRYELTHYIN